MVGEQMQVQHMMSEQQLVLGWQQRQDQRRAEAAGVEGKYDQGDALYLLKARDEGWTQERIAEKLGRSRPYVCQLLCFGSFLRFVASGNNHSPEAPGASIPSNLTERAFRDAWNSVGKRSEDGHRYSDEERFEKVLAALEALCHLDSVGMMGRRKPTKTAKILAQDYADGQWRTHEQVLADLEDEEGHETDERDLENALGSIRRRNAHGCMLEERIVKGQKHFRIRKIQTRQIKAEKVVRFYEEAAPLLKEAKSLTDRPITTVSMHAILHKLILLERLVKGLHNEIDGEE